MFCRARPLFEDEGLSVVEFPDEFTIRVNTCDDNAANPKKDFEFDRVYGPHVGQGELGFQFLSSYISWLMLSQFSALTVKLVHVQRNFLMMSSL